MIRWLVNLVPDFRPLRHIGCHDVVFSDVVNQCLQVRHGYPVALGGEIALQGVQPPEFSSVHHGLFHSILERYCHHLERLSRRSFEWPSKRLIVARSEI